MKSFRGEIREGHKGCAVEVPFDPVAEWGVEPSVVVYQRVRGIPVQGTVNGSAFTSFVISRWGKVFLLLGDAILDAAGIGPGEVASFHIAPSEEALRSSPSVPPAARSRSSKKKRE